ncbi:MAG: DUF4145 domain-containing protein [Vicinamibacterales bacterium]
MPNLTANLVLERCPHCSVASPNLPRQHHLETQDHAGGNRRTWALYVCGRCGGVVTACATGHSQLVQAHFPATKSVQDEVPEKPRAFLQQATESLHAPAGAVMLAASAVDAMLKIKGYSEGTLYSRIERAAAEHAVTADMARWAHDVRLDANDQRHADEGAGLPSRADAGRAIDFALALAEFMFVLPSRVQRGIQQAAG